MEGFSQVAGGTRQNSRKEGIVGTGSSHSKSMLDGSERTKQHEGMGIAARRSITEGDGMATLDGAVPRHLDT